MGLLNETIDRIGVLDKRLMEEAQTRLDNLTKPLGSLGRLEEIARQLVGITREASPSIKGKVIFTMAGDHGVVDEGVSAYPKEVTPQMVYNFLRGGAGINVLARQVGARVIIVDMGVSSELRFEHSELRNKKINFGTKNIAKGPAMSRDEAVRSIEAGIEVFNEELSSGIDIVGVGDMGIGNTTPSSAISATFTGLEVEGLTGRGTGIDDHALQHKISTIKRAIAVNRPNPNDAIDVLSKVGGFEIGGMCGVMLAAAASRVPVVIDGFISGAAALLAFHLEPKVRDFMIASHCSQERGHRIIQEHMGLKALLDFNLRLGEGTGAALAFGIIEASIKILTDMASFESAGVSKKC